MCSEYFDEGEDQATRDAAATEARKREERKLKEQTDRERRELLLEGEIDAERRRGRRGLQLAGADPEFAANLAPSAAYSVAPRVGTRIGG